MSSKIRKKSGIITVSTREEYLRQRAASQEPLIIKLTNHVAFRKVFKNKIALKGFLMALLYMKEDEIVSLEVIDPYEDGEIAEEKTGILDIKILLNNGKRINLEMQNWFQDDWSERTLFYNCRMFVEGYEHGTPYKNIEPCIHVGILSFNQLESPGFYHNFLLRDEQTKECYSSKFQIHVIELKKLDETPETAYNDLYRWAKLLAAEDWESVRAAAAGNPYMEEVEKVMIKMSQDERERYLYLRESMAYTDEMSRLETARNEGHQAGLQTGHQVGMQEGLRNLVETLCELDIPREAIVSKLMEKYSLTQEEAGQITAKYWK